MTTPYVHPLDWPVIPRQYRILKRRGRVVTAAMMPYPTLDSGAKCVGDEAYSEDLANMGSTRITYMKLKCSTCPLVTACAEWGIAHEEAYMYGGLTPGERRRIREERGQIVVEPSAAHEYGMNDEYVQNRGRQWKGAGNPGYVDGRWMAEQAERYASDEPWQEYPDA